jgi:phosphoglycolate phosphatase
MLTTAIRGQRQRPRPQERQPALRYALAIFDLDGTLADSFPWSARVLDSVADEFGFRRLAKDEIEDLRRLSPREILHRLDVPPWKLPRITRHMRRLKGEALAGIPLFPGAAAMLRILAQNGVQLALVSSDHEANARRQLGPAAALFSHFDCSASLFGKAQKFGRVLRQAGVARDAAIAIGDEIRDIAAARAAGIACGAVAWGYADPSSLRAASPDMLFECMEDITAAIR